MSLSPANPGGWSLNEVLTSAQMTFLQNELLKAIDGVDGGTYTLASSLTFAGANVIFENDIELAATGRLNANAGSSINVDSGALVQIDGDVDLTSGAQFDVEGGADFNVLSGATLDVLLGAVLNVFGVLDIESGGVLNINGTASIEMNGTSQLNVDGSAQIDIEGDLNVLTTGNVNLVSGANLILQSGADLIAQSGANIISQAGAIVQIEDAEDLTINDSPEGFRTTLVPFGYIATGWAPRLTAELVWEQIDVTSDWRIVFPIAVPPGDTLINVFVAMNGENGHGALPATMPIARIVRADVEGTLTTLATRTDQSGSTGAYEAPHFILLQSGSLDSGSMPILATDEPLYVIVSGETGANSIAGLEIGSITGNVTARSYRTDLAIYS